MTKVIYRFFVVVNEHVLIKLLIVQGYIRDTAKTVILIMGKRKQKQQTTKHTLSLARTKRACYMART